MSFLQQQMEFILRIIFAGVCGGLIGYERKNRYKEAGIRTHLIVASGAALIMMISKYGFQDILGAKGIALDPSRIAAQVVTGVGFLGAGMIFMRHNTINGLTTAAGIWVTSAIGMAIGCGLYIVGLATAMFIVLVQTVLHGHHRFFHESYKEEISFVVKKDKQNILDLKNVLHTMQIEILNVKITERTEFYAVNFNVVYPEEFPIEKLLAIFHQMNAIIEIDI